ncbi:MAG: hypothetical protein QG675_646, partial [Patescibacteria group bacterium]|nr:hypothetical protein [Patescibacteria group bacterium]
IKVPIDIIYGKFDILVISKHLEDLRKYDNIKVYKTNSRHDLTEGYSHKISQLVERSVSAK